jgi:hypothetical protein
VRYEFESLVGKDQYDLRENWTRQNIIDKSSCFIKACMKLGITHVNKPHKFWIVQWQCY